MRPWQQGLWLVVILSSFGCASLKSQTPSRHLSILQGSTDQTSTVINLLVPVDSKYTLSVREAAVAIPEGASASASVPVTAAPVRVAASVPVAAPSELSYPNSPWKLLTLTVAGLKAGTSYQLHVTDTSGARLDERSFNTLPQHIEVPRIALISCMDDSFADLQKSQWSEVWKQAPDYLFLIGDTVYVDIGLLRLTTITEKELWQRYVESRLRLDLYQQKHLIPVFSTWDDHDYGKNGGDRHFLAKEQSQKIFSAFFPMTPNAALTSGPGVSSRLRLGPHTFVFFDNRSFRDPKHLPGGTHFGAEQMAWFLSVIKSERGPLWLVSGDQFFGGYHPFDSYEGHHPESFANFLKTIKASRKTVLFISGDRHLAEIIRIPTSYLGYETFELTSSGLHARSYPGALLKTPHSRSIYGKDGVANYMIVKPQWLHTDLTVDVTVLGEHSLPLHHQVLNVSQRTKTQ